MFSLMNKSLSIPAASLVSTHQWWQGLRLAADSATKQRTTTGYNDSRLLAS